MSSIGLHTETSQKQRPATRRQKTRDIFTAKSSIREKQREQGLENAPIHVSILTCSRRIQ
jgi:hypothetical protein